MTRPGYLAVWIWKRAALGKARTGPLKRPPAARRPMRRVAWVLLALLLPGCAAPVATPASRALAFAPGPDGLAHVEAAGDAFRADVPLVEGAQARVRDLVVLENRADRDVPARLASLGDAPGPARLELRDEADRVVGALAWGEAPLDLVVPAHARLRVDLVASAPEGAAGQRALLGLRLLEGDGKPSEVK